MSVLREKDLMALRNQPRAEPPPSPFILWLEQLKREGRSWGGGAIPSNLLFGDGWTGREYEEKLQREEELSEQRAVDSLFICCILRHDIIDCQTGEMF